MWGAYFSMGAYKHNVVVVIEMGGNFLEGLFCVGAYYAKYCGIYSKLCMISFDHFTSCHEAHSSATTW